MAAHVRNQLVANDHKKVIGRHCERKWNLCELSFFQKSKFNANSESSVNMDFFNGVEPSLNSKLIGPVYCMMIRLLWKPGLVRRHSKWKNPRASL